MKKAFLFSLIFLFGSNMISAQNDLLITYKEKRIMTDFYKKNLNSYPPPIKNKFLKEFEGVSKVLIISGDESKYTSYESVQNEFSEKSPDKKEGNTTIKETVKVFLTSTDYYKSNSKKTLLVEKNVRGEDYVIKEPLYASKWKLINESKKINNLECKKATRKDEKGNTITAWYSEDVSINNGPAKYGGLPGIIVYLETKSWIYEMQGLKRVDAKGKVVMPSTKNAMTMAEFKEKFNPKNRVKKSTTTTRRLQQ